MGKLQVACIRAVVGCCGCSRPTKEEGNTRCGREVVESAMGCWVLTQVRELDAWVYIEIGERERGCTGVKRVSGNMREWRREWVKERGKRGR